MFTVDLLPLLLPTCIHSAIEICLLTLLFAFNIRPETLNICIYNNAALHAN